jgi:hypothetical protein
MKINMTFLCIVGLVAGAYKKEKKAEAKTGKR